jgi:hypothetical protein
VLDTKTQGRHKYTVNAVSADGLTATATVTYLVAPPVPVAISRPKLTGAAVVGRVLSCSQGVWRGHPYRYTYQWNRGNTPLAGAIHFRYRVTKLDEGSQLTCSVTASNGSVGDATSSALSPLLSASPSCPAPSGNLTAKQLATIKLGDTRVQANAALPDVRQSTARNSERFCLSPAGITIGFPGGKVAQLMRNDPQPGQVIWAMTANPSYNYDGITAGIALMTAEQRLGTGTVEQQGQTTFYLARTRASTVVVAARGQVVREIGIADHQATATPALIKALVATLPG